MADRDIPQHETYPDIMFRAYDERGTLELLLADEVTLLAQGTENDWELPVEALDPDDPANKRTINGAEVGCNGSAPIPEGFSDTLDEFEWKLKVVWNAASTPPKVQFVPKDGFMTLAITANVRGAGA